MTTTPCDAQVPLNVIQHCGTVLGLMNAWSTTPGLAQYARDQVNDQTYDVIAEYVILRDAIISCRDNLMGFFPKDANAWILYQTIQPSGRIQNRTFTAAQLAAAIPFIDAAASAIS